MNPSAVEIAALDPSTLDLENQRNRQSFFTLALTRRARGTQIADGIHGPGAYKGGTFTRDARIDGLGWHTVQGQVTFQSTGIVRGMVFERGVILTTTANMQFVGCVFLMPIVVASGGRIGCNGCEFNGTSAITNAGALGNANRVGCTGTSALAADANVAITGGI
jgi:hypothetical protein